MTIQCPHWRFLAHHFWCVGKLISSFKQVTFLSLSVFVVVAVFAFCCFCLLVVDSVFFFFFSLHLNNCKYIILWRPMGNDAGWWIMMHYFIRFNCNIIYIDSILGLVNELTDLFDCQDNEELSRAAASVKDILLDGQPHSLKNHRPITSLSPKHY